MAPFLGVEESQKVRFWQREEEEASTMATRTGRMVVDMKTGKMVEEMKEDQIAVALFDPACATAKDHSFKFVLRSDVTLFVPTLSLHIGNGGQRDDIPYVFDDIPAPRLMSCSTATRRC